MIQTLLFVSPDVHSKGIGYSAWCEVEKLHSEVRIKRYQRGRNHYDGNNTDGCTYLEI